MILRLLSLVLLATTASAASVAECKKLSSCEECADSYIHVFGFKEFCRWCVESNSCGGPISCPYGKPVVLRDPFKCPAKTQQVKGHRYTDALGRSLYGMVLASRDGNVAECLSHVRPDTQLIKHYVVECDSAHNTCSGYIAVSEEAKAIYVIFRGSTPDKQLVTEFFHGLAAQFGAWEKFEGGGGVITYFHMAFTKLVKEGGMKETLEDLKKKYPDYRVWVSGHSLGASLASITALYLVKSGIFEEKKVIFHCLLGSNQVRLVTFGEPRTGNVAFAKAVEDTLSFRFRVVHKNDFVTDLPRSMDPTNTLVPRSVYDRQPLFYRYLVHYDNGMAKGDTFRICELSDDHACRNLALAVDANDHNLYFGADPEFFIKARCPRNTLGLD